MMTREPRRASGHTLLDVSGLSTSLTTDRGMLRAVDNVTLNVTHGETVGVVGESGSGKSVLMRSIMGLLPDTAEVEGTVRFGAQDVHALSARERRRIWGPEIAMVFQDPMTSLNPVRKIERQITDPMRYHTGISRAEARQRALDLLTQVGIAQPARRLRQFPHELSGGMRQRVGIAIALSCEPVLLIADEPTTALDVTIQKQILELLAEVQHEREMAMILVTHDLGVIAGRTDRVVVMYAGGIIEEGATADIFARPRHPYTHALMRAVPRLDQPSHSQLAAIEGRPPDMVVPPPGCRFAPRCAWAQEDCRERRPQLERSGPGHSFACFHPIDTETSPRSYATEAESVGP